MNDIAKLSNQPFHVTIMDFDQKIYDGMAQSLSSINSKGPFDILGMHSNFISIINQEISIKEPSIKEAKKFSFKNAVLQCYNNEVKVYFGV